MPSYKLIYFNIRGGGEIARLLFAAAGKEYEDVRISSEDWPSKKPDMPLQAVPVLEVDGRKFCQSAAIARYLAREFGMMGKNNLDEFRIGEIHESMSELFQSMRGIFLEKDETKKAELKKTMIDETLPKFCCYFEKRLCENCEGKGFFIGNELTLADLLMYNAMQFLRAFLQKGEEPDPFGKFDKLKSHYGRIDCLPKIAAWVKKRPVTEF